MSDADEAAIQQRIRNRIIEYFELTASIEDQIAYQQAVPYLCVPFEIINQW